MTFFSPPLRRLFYACLAAAVLIVGARSVNAEPVGAGVATYVTSPSAKACPRCIVKPHGDPAHGVIAVATRYLGSRNPTRQRGPWCGHFVNLVLRQAGYRPMPGNRAIDGLRAGQRLSHAVPGALVIRRHHVEIALGDGRSISGNWGGRVAIHPTSRGVAVMPTKG